MSREIKFRGKRLDNGEWIYGSLRIWYDGTEVPQNYYIAEFEHWGSGHEVDPQTVGQYTGLKDKNGKEIYEGDILRLWCGASDGAATRHQITATVAWNDLCQLVPQIHDKEVIVVGGSQDGKKQRLAVIHSWSGMHHCFRWPEKLEIIGNIYENPELLKANANDKA
jgi:uncharacterized phage protein (TIGR01671 family)